MLVNRCTKNPIITMDKVKPSNNEMELIGVFNCGVTKFNGEVLLLLRVAEKVKSSDDNTVKIPVYDKTAGKVIVKSFDKKDKNIDFSDVRFVKTKEKLFLTSMSHLRVATSKDSINFEIEEKPFIIGDNEYEEFGVEDPRITYIDNYYYINYSAISSMGVTTCLARTKDFKSVEKLGVIFLSDNKDVAIFPDKIDGKYYALNRPVSAYFNKPEMWISTSTDLRAFYNHKVMVQLRQDKFDSARLGASCVPFLTEKGYVEIYHGCNADNHYYLGALLLDKDNPSKVLARTENPLFVAETEYELNGFMPKVIFSCGGYLENDTYHLYYGCCDESVCYVWFKLEDIFKELGQ